MKPIIEIQNLSKTFRGVPAVDQLSLSVPEGAVTAFLGPNGAGKTTTIKCLLNLLQADSGEARVLGCPSRDLGPDQFQRIGYVSENQKLPEWMTVQMFLDYVRPMYAEWDREFERRMAREFELPMKTKLRSLSRGQKMKAALLSSLAYRPKLVVLDEPFSGLDPLVRDEFLHGLLELTETEGWSVFISSHDIEEVQRLCDRVAIINRGHIQLDESAEDLLARFRAVEVTIENGSTIPPGLPDGWLNPQLTGRTLRFVESSFDPEGLPSLIAKHLPAATHHDHHAMSLREIFVALAKTYRLATPPSVAA